MFGITKEQVLDAFKFRSACRYYDPERKISDEDFDYLLELARLSPSSVGSEPWKFLVVQNHELREQLKPVSWGMARQLDNCSHLVFFLAKKNATYDSDFLREGLAQRGLNDEQMTKAVAMYENFQKNDIEVYGSERALLDWTGKQTYIALANMMTGAALIGIDSCPVEGFDYKAVNRILADAGAFDPNEWGVAVACTFGYRAKEITQKFRRPKDELVVWMK